MQAHISPNPIFNVNVQVINTESSTMWGKNLFPYQYILQSVYSSTCAQNNFDPIPWCKYNNYATQNTFSS